jgi:hypothetical protein
MEHIVVRSNYIALSGIWEGPLEGERSAFPRRRRIQELIPGACRAFGDGSLHTTVVGRPDGF